MKMSHDIKIKNSDSESCVANLENFQPKYWCFFPWTLTQMEGVPLIKLLSKLRKFALRKLALFYDDQLLLSQHL